MVDYDGPPACTRCGGRLEHSGEVCVCGGRSQYYERYQREFHPDGLRHVAEALAALDAKRELLS
jgi:hypothetical protein